MTSADAQIWRSVRRERGELLTIEEAAARRGCSASTIWRAIKSGELKPVRVLGRVTVETASVDRMQTPQGSGRWRKKS